MRPFRRSALSILVVVPLVLAGCSKSSSTATPGSSTSAVTTGGAMAAADYVAAVCGAFQDYATSVGQRQASFTPTGTDVASIKQTWLTFLDGMIQDTQTLVTKIEALGPPDVTDGQAAANTLKTDFATLQSDLQALRDQSASLPTTSAAAFTAAFQPLLAKFQTDMQGFGSDLNQFNGGELDAAFSAAPECANFGSSSPTP